MSSQLILCVILAVVVGSIIGKIGGNLSYTLYKEYHSKLLFLICYGSAGLLAYVTGKLIGFLFLGD